MQTEHIYAERFLIGLLFAAFALVCVLFAPYLAVFVLTVVFGVIFAPVNTWLTKRMHPTLAAILTTVLVGLMIAGPVAFVVTQIVREASGLAAMLGTDPSAAGIDLVQAKIQQLFPEASVNIIGILHSVLNWISSRLGGIVSGILTAGIDLFLALLALVYWFQDSNRLRSVVIKKSPLGETDTRNILNSLNLSIHSVIKGTLVVALVQGVVAGIGFTIFGVPNAVLWGSVAAICALVPTIGTAIITIPMIAYLLLIGHVPQGIGLTAWSLLAIGLVDNLIGPHLMARGSSVHPFFILIGVLGGVNLLGPVGLFAGPLIVSFFFALADTYASHTHEDTKS